MAKRIEKRLLVERSVDQGDAPGAAARSVTVNLAESPLGWLFARKLVTAANLTPASGCAAIGSAAS